MSGLFDKVYECVKLLCYNQLKENSDDCYPEKLLDVLNDIKEDLSLDQLKQLLNLLFKCLEESLSNVTICSNISLKLIGLLLKSDHFKIEPGLIDDYINSLASFATRFEMNNCANYSVQHSFIICLSALTSNLQGCIWICSSDTILHTLFQMMIQMNGYYVKQKAEMLVYQILQIALKSNHTKLLINCDPYLHQILLLNNLALINCLKSLLKDKTVRQQLLDRYEIDVLLINKLSSIKDDFIISYCECLALSLSSQSLIQEMIQSLQKLNKLKGLIAFVSQIITFDLSFNKLWIYYSCSPFVIHSKADNLIPLSDAEREWFQTLTTKSEHLFILSKIDSSILSSLDKEQSETLVTCLKTFVKNSINKRETKKVTFGCIQKLHQIAVSLTSSQLQHQANLEQIILLFTSVLPNLKSQEKCEILKYLRNIVKSDQNNLISFSLQSHITQQLSQLFTLNEIENELDTIDSIIEVLIILLEKDHSLLINSNCHLINTLIAIWKKSHDLSLYNLNMSCLPFLLNLDLNMSQDDLFKFGFNKFDDIPNLIAFHLNGDYNIKLSSIKAIYIHLREYTQTREDTYHSNHNYVSTNFDGNLCDIFYDHFALPLASLIRTETDSEILYNTINIWFRFINLIMSKSSLDFENLFKKCSFTGLFHSIYLLLQSDYITLSTKREAVKVINLFKNQIIISKINQATLINWLDQCPPSILTSISKFDECTQKNCELNCEVIDKIFNDESVLPAQDLISKLNQAPSQNLNISKELKPVEVSSSHLNTFLFESNFEQIKDQTVDTKIKDMAILDDIIAAKGFTNSFATDCY